MRDNYIYKRRLIKTANNMPQQKQLLLTLAQTGRAILQQMEQWKYEVNQCKGVANMMQDADKLQQQFDMIDTSMSVVADVCYELENSELVPPTPYQDSQIDISPQENADYDLEEEVPLEETEDVENPEPEAPPVEEGAEGEDGEGGMPPMDDGGDMGGGDDGGFNFG